MSNEQITVSHPDVSPVEADIIERHFVKASNKPTRPKFIFSAINSSYDARAGVMTIIAEMTPNASPEIGRIAVERAFQAAQYIAQAS